MIIIAQNQKNSNTYPIKSHFALSFGEEQIVKMTFLVSNYFK